MDGGARVDYTMAVGISTDRMHQDKINGRTVMVEEGAEEGLRYLKYDLQSSESDVFFHEAKRIGKADFEGDQDHNFTLRRNTDGTYTISRRP